MPEETPKQDKLIEIVEAAKDLVISLCDAIVEAHKTGGIGTDDLQLGLSVIPKVVNLFKAIF